MAEEKFDPVQCKRIQEMETILDRAVSLVNPLSSALAQLEENLPAIQQLIDYYQSPLWMHDYDDDADGKLPSDLKRGVLSQDAVYNFLADYDQLFSQMQDILEATRQNNQ